VKLELFDRHGHLRLDVENRLADLALLTCGPLVALGVAGTSSRAGLGLGAFPVLVVPLALLTHGYMRTQRAHENLFAWIRAVSVAPEYPGIVKPGYARRVVDNALELADWVGLDPGTRDQLEAAAWMERVGACCIDDGDVTETEHQKAIALASAEILESSSAFATAAQILKGTLNASTAKATTPLDSATQILQAAIALEAAPRSRPIEDALPEVPQYLALVRAAGRQAPGVASGARPDMLAMRSSITAAPKESGAKSRSR
jgi:hypothetical protein